MSWGTACRACLSGRRPSYSSAGILPQHANGFARFSELAGLIPGHTCEASKEDAFYPGVISNLFDGQGSVKVEVPVGGEISGIQLTVKPAGRLEVGGERRHRGRDRSVNMRIERFDASNRWEEGGKLGNWWLSQQRRSVYGSERLLNQLGTERAMARWKIRTNHCSHARYW